MKQHLTSLLMTGLVLVYLLAACSILPASPSSDQVPSAGSTVAAASIAADCAQLVTAERVGNGLYKQFEIGEKLKQGRFQRYESGGYVLCHYADPETSTPSPTLDIRYLFDGATNDLVLTHVEWRNRAGYQETGAPVLNPRCEDYLTEARLGHAVFKHYRIAEKLEHNEFTSMPSRGIFSCLTVREIGGTAVSEDELLFEFDLGTQQLLFWRIHWRADLSASVPELKISRADASRSCRAA